ncbi:MAG: carboxypeptidase Q [Salibacteraceae bacterium]|jgi:carboxypeptidase Q
MKRNISTFLFFACVISGFSQDLAPVDTLLNTHRNDTLILKKIFNTALSQGKSYRVLAHLCANMPARLSGSENAAKAVKYMKSVMDSYKFDTVYLQPVMVPHWVRGAAETAYFKSGTDEIVVNICALGGSIGTNGKSVMANIIEVGSVEELKALDDSQVKGKIVFLNGAMNSKYIRTFKAYSESGAQRWTGPWLAQEKGAVGVIVRSLTTIEDKNPHTGSMGSRDNNKGIPSAAISTFHANQLAKTLRLNPMVEFSMRMNCETLPDTLSYNVIGEIWGSEKPEEIVVVGGHLDAWDNGEGAHDDGAGCVQSVEVLRLFKKLQIQPKRTIRVVLFMNEENGLNGGKAFADSVKSQNENIIAAIESDAGGFTPRYFVCQTHDERLATVSAWLPLFKPYSIYAFEYGHGGADISPLDADKTLLIGYRPDSQRYFDFHHAATDKFEAINQRELELGGANMAALVYLLSEHGL